MNASRQTLSEPGRLERVKSELQRRPRRWLITGCAGFIGSNLLETLLKLGQQVTGLDNFSTGHAHNLDQVRREVGALRWSDFRFMEGDIRDLPTCRQACLGVDLVLHQAALGSVPRSIQDPLGTHESNVNGFFNMLVAARDAQVARFVYAASSAAYGDHPGSPKVEHRIGAPLSPYAVTKVVNEMYAQVFGRCYSMPAIGLRYFNVFGKRQDPEGQYAAVIPAWIAAMIRDQDVFINGDGSTSRDFCFIENVVQANLLAALAPEGLRSEVYNVAVGECTTLLQLHEYLVEALGEMGISVERKPLHRAFRAGDIQHSLADIGKARAQLGYEPAWRVAAGLRQAMPWYVSHCTETELALPLLSSPRRAAIIPVRPA